MIGPGVQVEHEEFGIGKVLAVLGNTATVEFFGEKLDVDVGELMVRADWNGAAVVPPSGKPTTNLAFRRSFEAINVGVVPTDPDQLVRLTIGGDAASDCIRPLLRDAAKRGACRVVMGYYGSGKSHYLRLVKAIALREGWVAAWLELDPKAADPAKPSSVYQELLASLEFPMRADGTRSEDFFDLVKEIRDNWTKIRSLKYFRCSPWFIRGMEALQYLSHRRDDSDYVSAVSWLAGQVKQISVIRSISRQAGYRESIPAMPQLRDTGLLYAFQLVVIHEVLRALGYQGLAIVVDEAEHVRSYSWNRYVRAKNFFDIITRCAHRPRRTRDDPHCDYEDVFKLPSFWKEGPHFSLFVGLTEGDDTGHEGHEADDMNVLIHSQEDVVQLELPSAEDYAAWCATFLAEAAGHLGPKVGVLSDARLRKHIVDVLRQHFERAPDSEKLLRNWTKMAGFPAAVLMSHQRSIGRDELVSIVEDAAREVANEVFPWDE